MAITTVKVQASRGGKEWQLDQEWQRAIVAETSRQYLRKFQSDGAFPVDPDQYITKVNGKSGHGRESRVQMRGPLTRAVTYIRNDTDASTSWIPAALEMLRVLERRSVWAPKSDSVAHSTLPFRRNHHMDRYVLLRDGAPLVRWGPGFFGAVWRKIEAEKKYPTMQPGEVMSIVNLQPYARRIEEGWSLRAPSGILKAAGRSRARKLDLLYRKFEYRPLPASFAHEADTQGRDVVYAETRKQKFTGAIKQIHRVYPTLHFGPANATGEHRVPKDNKTWSGADDLYSRDTSQTRGVSGLRPGDRRARMVINQELAKAVRGRSRRAFHGTIKVRVR